MRDAFGRDDFVHYEDRWFWTCDYRIVALDLERDALFLIDEKTNKLLSYSISTGKLNEIKDSSHCWYVYYVACYSNMGGYRGYSLYSQEYLTILAHFYVYMCIYLYMYMYNVIFCSIFTH